MCAFERFSGFLAHISITIKVGQYAFKSNCKFAASQNREFCGHNVRVWRITDVCRRKKMAAKLQVLRRKFPLISAAANLSRNLGVSRQGSPLQSWTQIEMADFASMRDCETPFHFRIFKLDLINIEALLNAFKRQSF